MAVPRRNDIVQHKRDPGCLQCADRIACGFSHAEFAVKIAGHIYPERQFLLQRFFR